MSSRVPANLPACKVADAGWTALEVLAGLKYKMACGSMVFKFESTYKEFFEPALKVGKAATSWAQNWAGPRSCGVAARTSRSPSGCRRCPSAVQESWPRQLRLS